MLDRWWPPSTAYVKHIHVHVGLYKVLVCICSARDIDDVQCACILDWSFTLVVCAIRHLIMRTQLHIYIYNIYVCVCVDSVYILLSLPGQAVFCV